MNGVRERIKYVTAVVLYGTIGYFLRFVPLPSEIAVFCRGLIGSLFLLGVMAVRKQNRLYISINLAFNFFCASQKLDRIS